MSELKNIADTFGKSKPVYKMVVEGGHLNFELKEQYILPIVAADPVHALVRAHYSEVLNKEARDFESSVNLHGVFHGMVQAIKQLYLNTSPLKNPKQSKTYKWLCDLHTARYDCPSSVGLIGLYRYIMNNGIEDTRDKTNQHAKNVLAVLEVMKDKL